MAVVRKAHTKVTSKRAVGASWETGVSKRPARAYAHKGNKTKYVKAVAKAVINLHSEALKELGRY